MKIPFAQCSNRCGGGSFPSNLIWSVYFSSLIFPHSFIRTLLHPHRLKLSFFTRISKGCSHSIWVKHLENHPAWNGGRKRVEEFRYFFHFSLSPSFSEEKIHVKHGILFCDFSRTNGILFRIPSHRLLYGWVSISTPKIRFISHIHSILTAHIAARPPIFITFFPVLTFLRCSHITRNHFYRMFLFIFTASYFMCVCVFVVRLCVYVCLCVRENNG